MIQHTEADLPEAWRKQAPPEMVATPEPDHTDAAHLYAWYGPFGLAQEYRKVVLSSCHEIVRAQATLEGKGLTDKAADARAHLHPAYLGFLERTLQGRILYEREAAKRGFGL